MAGNRATSSHKHYFFFNLFTNSQPKANKKVLLVYSNSKVLPNILK